MNPKITTATAHKKFLKKQVQKNQQLEENPS